MKYTNGERGFLRAVALGQVLLLVAAGCKSSSNKGANDVLVSQALVGKDGAVTVSAANCRVNGYSALTAATAVDVAPGTVTVNNINDFTADTTSACTRPALAVGDLVLIIQMAGATIDTTDTTAYGSVSDLGSAGNYELGGVAGIAGSVITLGCPLKKSYSATGRAQVIRVPQYTTLTIGSGASITAPAWNGTVGGVVAVHASNTLQLNGSIDVSATGFRGGVTDNFSLPPGSNVVAYRSNLNTFGAMKGESIAGWPGNFAYPYGRGAPANGGGGGDSHNAGGGGGANAAPSGEGSDAGGANNWTGQGVMLSNVTGASAWLLDPGYALSGGPGGGRGGYTYSNSNQNATTTDAGAGVAPGNTLWAGDNRRQVGGLGGHPLTSSTGGTNPRLFLGGGGGAGDGNDGHAGRGGQGGGLVFVIAGTVAGTGSIFADGENGADADSNNAGQGDGPGGGGGGGTVVVHAALLSGIAVAANGGPGGNQTNLASAIEAEGPGGGGGGGYIALSGSMPAPPSLLASGGLGGTVSLTGPLSEFPSNGATAGNTGVTNGDATSLLFCTDSVLPVTIIVTHPNNPTNARRGAFTFTSTGGVFPADGAVPADGTVTFQCNLDSGGYQSCPAVYTTPAPDLDNGEHTISVRATDLSGNQGPPVDYTWTVDLIAPDTFILTSPSDPSPSPTAHFTFSSNESGEAGEPGITFQCSLNGAAPAACPADYTITGLSDGSYTLNVSAQDAAGNVDASPATFTWEVHALGLDGGADAQPQEAGAEDTSPELDTADAPVVLLDAEIDASPELDSADAQATIVDAPATGDDGPATSTDDGPGTVVLLDAGADLAAVVDLAPSSGQDVPPIGTLDAAADAPDAGAAGLVDAILDGNGGDAEAQDAQVVVLLDAGSSDAFVEPDQAVLPPDAEMVADAPAVGQEPDAQENNSLKVMGSGFCAVSPMRNSAPGLFSFLLVAAFGLLLRRRRR